MAELAKTFQFSQLQPNIQDGVNVNLDDIIAYINDRNNGDEGWDDLVVTGPKPWVDVRAFGAVGDDSTNDTAAIQAAVDSIPSGSPGGVVFIPPGTYRIHSAITIPRSLIWFVGCGPDISILTCMTAGANGLHFSSGGNGGVCNLQINAGVTKSAGAGILFDTWGSAFIDRVNIGGQFIGIKLLDSNVVRVSNSLIQYTINTTGVGILIDGGLEHYITQTFVKGTDAANQCKACIEIVNSGAFYLDYVSCLFAATGLLLDPASTDEVAAGFMSNCVFDSMGGDGLKFAPGASARVKYIHSTGDSYTSDSGHGINFAGPGEIEAIRITDAFIVNNGTHGINLAVGTDISISDCIISGNSTASSGTSSGISVAANVNEFSFIGNRSGKTATIPANSQKYGIEVVAGTSNNYVIANNDLHTNATAGLLNGGTGTTQKVFGNIPDEVDLLNTGLKITPTTNQLVLGTTRTVTVSAPTPATASRVYTMPDIGSDASFTYLEGIQTLTGAKTLSAAAGNPIHGTNTNDSAAAGYIGETASSVVGFTNFPATTVFGDLTSISLTAGDWDVTALAQIYANSAAVTEWQIGITASSGTSTSGLVDGSNYLDVIPPTALSGGNKDQGAIPTFRVSLSGTTTYYFKYAATYTVATPQAAGRLSARRVR